VNLTLRGALDHEIEGPPHLTDAVHAMKDAPVTQAFLRGRMTRPLPPEGIGQGHAHVAVDDLAMMTPGMTPDGHAALDLESRRIRWDDDLGHLLVDAAATVVLFGATHDDREVCIDGVGGEPLTAIDHPIVAVFDRPRLDRARIRTGIVGLGHREARFHVAGDQRLQPLLLLLLRAKLQEQSLIPGVGCHYAKQ